MKKVIVTNAGGGFTTREEPIHEPGSAYARVKVQACGVCHSDALTKEGTWPGIVFPRVPGHEIAGVIDALGAEADPWKIGDRVGIGWHGGHCGKCESCRRGDFITCAKLQIQVSVTTVVMRSTYLSQSRPWPTFPSRYLRNKQHP